MLFDSRAFLNNKTLIYVHYARVRTLRRVLYYWYYISLLIWDSMNKVDYFL